MIGLQNIGRLCGLLVLSAAVFLTVASCSDPSSSGTGEPDKKPTLSITSSSSVSVEAAAQSVDVSFSTSESWTAASDVAWMTVSPSSGSAGSGKVTVSVRENTDESSRSGKITVKAGTLSSSVSITQKGHVTPLSFASKVFEEYLVGRYDNDKDGGISEAEAKAIKEIHICTSGIESIDEIRFMPNLEVLVASGHAETKAGSDNIGDLKSVDLSANGKLKVLDCSYNRLPKLDVSANTSLTDLDASHNELASIDLAKNTGISCLDVSYNRLTSIDVSGNKALKSLDVSHNDISSLNLAANTGIKDVDCSGNSRLETVVIPPSSEVDVTADSKVEVVEDGKEPGGDKEEGGKDEGGKDDDKPATVAVTGISLDKTSAELTEGETITLNATVNPTNATNKNIKWSSSDASVASVKDGVVTAVKAGTTTITVTTEDGAKTATCKVTVKAKVIAVTSVSLDKTSAELTEGETVTLKATVNPTNATNTNIKWSSSDASIATVKEGVVTAVKAGSATITVTTEDGAKTATCKVTVKAKEVPGDKDQGGQDDDKDQGDRDDDKPATVAVTGISLDKTSTELTEGETLTLNATVNPTNATNKNIKWSSSDTGVATVKEGVVTAVKAGSATITVTTEDGSKTATCKVTVKAKVIAVTSITLDKTSAELTEGETLTLNATVNPSNATNKNIKWSSSDASVATVKDGVVTAVKAGSATITVTTEDGSKTATCQVTVKAKVIAVTSVTLDKTTATLEKGATLQLTATVGPQDATDKTVTWTSSDKAIASVSPTGLVTALVAGTTTITAKAGEVTATCIITVKAAGESGTEDVTDDGQKHDWK